MSLPKITQKNYYDPEINQAYWSASQIKSFLSCEARAMAELSGEYTRPTSTALLIGSYIDCILTEPNKFDGFILDHPEMFKKDGSLKSEFVHATEMAKRAKQDDTFMAYLSGQHQKILSGTLFGYPFRAKLDAYKKGKYITDLKTVKDLEPLYRKGEGRLSPIEFWGWDVQLAIYAELEGTDLPTYLAIITKENPPDLVLVEVEKHRREACLEYIAEKLPRLDAVKRGIIEPHRCELCEYCRATRKISGPIGMDEWILNQYEM